MGKELEETRRGDRHTAGLTRAEKRVRVFDCGAVGVLKPKSPSEESHFS